MLGLGWSEMLVLAAVVLIVVGPKDLPVMLRNMGRMMGTVRRMSNEFRREIDKAVAIDEVKDAKRALSDPLRKTSQEINREFNAIRDGRVEPSGKLKPSDPGTENVADAIRAQAGMTESAAAAGGSGSGAGTGAAKKTAAKKTTGKKTTGKTAAATTTTAKTAAPKTGTSAPSAAKQTSAPQAETARAKKATGGKTAKAATPASSVAQAKAESASSAAAPKPARKTRKAAPKRTSGSAKAEAGVGPDSGKR